LFLAIDIGLQFPSAGKKIKVVPPIENQENVPSERPWKYITIKL